jgi:hypothetical protein
MMIKASKFAIAIAAVASLAIAAVEESSAAPVTVGANTVMVPAATEVQYRTYFDDDYGPYTYRPAYRYRGYTYWYPSYGSSVYPGEYYYYDWW